MHACFPEASGSLGNYCRFQPGDCICRWLSYSIVASPPQCLRLAYFRMIKVIPVQFESLFSKAYQICASGPVPKRGNRHIFCEGMLKRALLPCVCQMGDGIGSSTCTKWKMCHIVSKLCARCPRFFPCLTPLSPRQFSRSLVLTFARITYHC